MGREYCIFGPRIQTKLIFGLVMPISQTYTAGVEMKRPPKMTYELHMGMPAGIYGFFLGLQVLTHFFIGSLIARW